MDILISPLNVEFREKAVIAIKYFVVCMVTTSMKIKNSQNRDII